MPTRGKTDTELLLAIRDNCHKMATSTMPPEDCKQSVTKVEIPVAPFEPVKVPALALHSLEQVGFTCPVLRLGSEKQNCVCKVLNRCTSGGDTEKQ